ncbi:hypothetical protein GGR25_001094 [Kaistia hirudinis]|uniref:Uncharacterized protein n=1 Tax=Kaistia hirudinis TaxID=1293440 RepID=A0A840ANF2_9HYPH|nr:hypothetical protein [Kaistia hirudinis]MBB3930055.1 hypothetical protein [Kaistia hirudinis]
MTNVIPFRREHSTPVQARLVAAVARGVGAIEAIEHPIITMARTGFDTAHDVLLERDALEAQFRRGGMQLISYRRRMEAIEARIQNAIGPFVEAQQALESWRPVLARDIGDRSAWLDNMSAIESDGDELGWTGAHGEDA